MLAARDVMRSDVVTVPPELTLRDLLGVLVGEGVSGVPVVAAGRVLGVISATDILEFEEGAAPAPRAREAVPDDAEWILEGDEDRNEGDGSASQFFTDMWEPAEVDVAERIDTSDAPEWDILNEHTVSELMSRRILSCRPDAPLDRAARYMLRNRVHRVLVIEDGELCGIVTTTDIVRAVADGWLSG